MIGMNMRVKDAANLPTMAPRQVDIYLRVKRGINHHGLLACADEVREATFSGASHLKNMHSVASYRYFCDVPGQAPRLHPTLKGKRLYPSCLKLLRRNQARFASATDGHNRYIARNAHVGKRCRIMRFQGVIRINMDTARNSPFRPFSHRTHIQHRHWSSLFQPGPQGLDTNGHHACTPVPLSTGSPRARQSGSPCSSRRALYPLVCSRATASSANTQ